MWLKQQCRLLPRQYYPVHQPRFFDLKKNFLKKNRVKSEKIKNSFENYELIIKILN